MERQSGKKGHVLCFPESSPDLIVQKLHLHEKEEENNKFPKPHHARQSMDIILMGSLKQWEGFTASKWNKIQPIQIRPHEVFVALKILKHINPLYRDCVIDESPTMTKTLTDIPNILMEDAKKRLEKQEKDEKLIEIERIVSKINETNQVADELEDEANTEEEDDYNNFPSSLVTHHNPIQDGKSTAETIVFDSMINSLEETHPEDETKNVCKL